MHSHNVLSCLERCAYARSDNGPTVFVAQNSRHGNLRVSTQVGFEIGTTSGCGFDFNEKFTRSGLGDFDVLEREPPRFFEHECPHRSRDTRTRCDRALTQFPAVIASPRGRGC